MSSLPSLPMLSACMIEATTGIPAASAIAPPLSWLCDADAAVNAAYSSSGPFPRDATASASVIEKRPSCWSMKMETMSTSGGK